MTTISVGQTMEIIAEQAAQYAAEGKPDLEDRVSALADHISAAVDSPTMNAPRFFQALFGRLDAAAESLAAVNHDKRGQPDENELHSQKLFFAAMAHQFRERFESAAA